MSRIILGTLRTKCFANSWTHKAIIFKELSKSRKNKKEKHIDPRTVSYFHSRHLLTSVVTPLPNSGYTGSDKGRRRVYKSSFAITWIIDSPRTNVHSSSESFSNRKRFHERYCAFWINKTQQKQQAKNELHCTARTNCTALLRLRNKAYLHIPMGRARQGKAVTQTVKHGRPSNRRAGLVKVRRLGQLTWRSNNDPRPIAKATKQRPYFRIWSQECVSSGKRRGRWGSSGERPQDSIGVTRTTPKAVGGLQF